MSLMAYEITVNPEIQEKLFQEIVEMEKKLDGKSTTYEDIQSMKFMDQVVSETLRKWPPNAVRKKLLFQTIQK